MAAPPLPLWVQVQSRAGTTWYSPDSDPGALVRPVVSADQAGGWVRGLEFIRKCLVLPLKFVLADLLGNTMFSAAGGAFGRALLGRDLVKARMAHGGAGDTHPRPCSLVSGYPRLLSYAQIWGAAPACSEGVVTGGVTMEPSLPPQAEEGEIPGPYWEVGESCGKSV